MGKKATGNGKTRALESREERKKNRFDYALIAETVGNGSRVLDLGCGAGTLLKLLREKRHVDGRGIEIKPEHVQKCVERGLSVLQGDLDAGLKHYRDNSFDYVIFNQTMPVVRNSLLVLKEALRVGKRVIVSFPNFGHWQIRFPFLFSGRMPKSRSLPYEWYNSPNIRFLTINDFRALCRKHRMRIIKEYNYTNKNGDGSIVRIWPNMLAENSLFVLEKA